MPLLVPFAEADAILDGALSESFQGEYATVLLVDGDLTVDGDLLENLPGVEEAELIAVRGDLTVHGRIASYETYPGLYVGGVTRAETLEAGDCEVYIQDGEFSYMVYGYYNDGILETGTVATPWVINSDHYMVLHAPGAYLVDERGEDDDADFTDENIVESFVPEVVDAEYQSLNVTAFLARLRAGLPVLRPGAMTMVEAAMTEVNRAVETRATELDLSGYRLRSVPDQVLSMPWLRRLILDDNPIETLPEGIGALSELEVLSVAHCRLELLPDGLGRLTNLRELDISDACPPGLDEDEQEDEDEPAENVPFPLPASCGGLTRLRVLRAVRTNVVFPDSMRGLDSLEEIDLSGSSYRFLRTFPEAVTTFPNLRRLNLSNHQFDALPGGLLRLQRLEELNLDASLALVRSPLPDLGQLPNLRVLQMDGRSDRTDIAVPSHDILRAVLAMDLSQVEQLGIDRWGSDDQSGRRELTADDIAGVGRCQKLTRLDLSFNGLTELPEQLFALPSLAQADLRYNGLPRAVRERLVAAYPEARLDLRNQRGAHLEAERAGIQAASELVKRANSLRDDEQWTNALAAYDEAIAEVRSGRVDSAYNLLYAHYGKMWIHGKLGYDDSVDEQARVAHRRSGVIEAEACLELVPPVWLIWHYTDEGEFEREVVRYATNFIAWELMADPAGDTARALSLIEQGVACVNGPEHLYVRDTHARVLLALGREAEAWVVVEQALAVDPDFADIADLARDERYQAWLR